MRKRKAKFKTKPEVRVARVTLNRIDTIAQTCDTVEEVRFAIMLMREELKRTEQFIEIKDIKEEIKRFNNQVETYMSCRWGPCHLCHHLNNGCYEPSKEVVEEIKNRWTDLVGQPTSDKE